MSHNSSRRNVRLVRGSIPNEINLTYTAQGELSYTTPISPYQPSKDATPKDSLPKKSLIPDGFSVNIKHGREKDNRK